MPQGKRTLAVSEQRQLHDDIVSYIEKEHFSDGALLIDIQRYFDETHGYNRQTMSNSVIAVYHKGRIKRTKDDKTGHWRYYPLGNVNITDTRLPKKRRHKKNNVHPFPPEQQPKEIGVRNETVSVHVPSRPLTREEVRALVSKLQKWLSGETV